ncbi:MAG TPA: CAP domain-containing protein [Methylomirabilota bacterium]|nr:CAP domain-containing protein [Methylomirabilota bacterium]
MLHQLFAVLLAALCVSACQTPPPPPVKPTFYEDLGRPGASVDQQKAAEMISGYRARFGVAPVRLDPELSRIAADYARQMAEADKMTHSLSDASRIGARLKANGYAFDAAGENIAAGYRTLADAFSGWRDSPAHDRGMKDADMTVVGIGTAYNPNSKYKVFWCLILARPKGETLGAPGVGPSPTLVAPAEAAPVE